MSYRTNRKTRGVFKLGSKDARQPTEGKIIKGDPEIIGFEDAGSIYVEDGSGERYTVKYADGSTAEVEFYDAFDPDSSDENTQSYNMTVVWDGAVDFSESYDANSDDSVDGMRHAIVARYGKIGEDFVGITAQEINAKITGTQTPRSQENRGIFDTDDAEDILGGTKGTPSKESGLLGESEEVFGESGTGILGDDE